jgi:hypothetical protein
MQHSITVSVDVNCSGNVIALLSSSGAPANKKRDEFAKKVFFVVHRAALVCLFIV